ncbi:MAG: Rep protein [CRESS virus sp. ctmn412]|nr:MAG: Rep protein [CRESS virus sp. ctmn412]
MARQSNSKKPRVNRSRSWFFTYNNPPENAWAQIIDTFENDQCEYVFQLEQGDTVHYQGVIRYKNPRENWPQISCHWERCISWRSAIKYCSKVQTRIDGPWTNIDGLKFRDTIKDPLQNKKLYPFQQEILDIIKTDSNDRVIYWYWEPNGNTGKSSLCKHIMLRYKACLIGGAAKDNFHCVSSYLEDNDLKVCLIDIPRCSMNSVSYKTIECIKNGIIFSGKYESNYKIFNSPHLIILANFPPNTDMLSEDRWVVKRI